ncbi:MAG: hypothetical protein WA324_15045 [Bryobacteraceae bacterium]
MYLFELFRSFLPYHNPIGFGVSDFVLLAFAILLGSLALLSNRRGETAFRKFSERTGWCMLVLTVLPIALRLALLRNHPAPTPSGADDFSYLLLADTLRHFRLANPVHALHQFFETNFVLQQPSYSSIYPLVPALPLAFGQLLFGIPWAGVLLSEGMVAGFCYWMLRGWTTSSWALVGGLLAVFEFGPLCYAMNCYWGGAVSALAGCLVFGALPRLRQEYPARTALLLGCGLGLQMLSRPYESLLLDFSVLLFFAPALRDAGERRRLSKAMAITVCAIVPAVVLVLLQNKAVTGAWTTLPYQLSRYRYAVPTTFTFQPNAMAHGSLTNDQELYALGQAQAHGEQTETPARYLMRLSHRVGAYRFFLLPPLYLVLPLCLLSARQFRYAWVIVTLAIFALGSNFYPYFFPHYIAAVTCLFVLLCVAGLQRLSQVRLRGVAVGVDAARWILMLCAAQFLFWYGLHLFGNENVLVAIAPYESGDNINFDDPEGRIAINDQLAGAPGKQLVFVRYSPQHQYHEWIHNAADIDGARVVWANDLGVSQNRELEHYFPGRRVWLLEPDVYPPKLTSYETNVNPFSNIQ